MDLGEQGIVLVILQIVKPIIKQQESVYLAMKDITFKMEEDAQLAPII